jgi:GMC oxidoreductase
MMMNGMKTARKLLLGRPLNDSTSTAPHTGKSIPPSTTSANDCKVVSKVENVPLHCFEAVPGSLFGNTEELEGFTNYSKHVGNTYFHISGTCAMETDRHGDEGEEADAQTGAGSAISNSSSDCNGDNGSVCGDGDNMAVVDVNLRVRGVRNLRVGDASVFPRIPSSPTSATCMAVGATLARLILEAGSQ